MQNLRRVTWVKTTLRVGSADWKSSFIQSLCFSWFACTFALSSSLKIHELISMPPLIRFICCLVFVLFLFPLFSGSRGIRAELASTCRHLYSGMFQFYHNNEVNSNKDFWMWLTSLCLWNLSSPLNSRLALESTDLWPRKVSLLLLDLLLTKPPVYQIMLCALLQNRN